MKILLLFFFSFILSKHINAQRIEIDKFKIRIVSIDPNSKRLFVSYDYLFPSEAPETDSQIIKNLILIRDTMQKYLSCLFQVKYISFFRSSVYAKYGPPENLEENIQWGKDYLGEYDVLKNEYTSFPGLKTKSKTITPL
jgi:hypothetical protein